MRTLKDSCDWGKISLDPEDIRDDSRNMETIVQHKKLTMDEVDLIQVSFLKELMLMAEKPVFTLVQMTQAPEPRTRAMALFIIKLKEKKL